MEEGEVGMLYAAVLTASSRLAQSMNFLAFSLDGILLAQGTDFDHRRQTQLQKHPGPEPTTHMK